MNLDKVQFQKLIYHCQLIVQLLVDQDLKVLVVSSDPAHSLGDALDEDLRRGRGKPVSLTDPLTGGRLHGSEVNAEAALADFRENLASFDIDRLSSSLVSCKRELKLNF